MQRYFAKDKENNIFTLYESDLHHIKNVMRMQVNDQIEVVFDSIVYLCQIKNINPINLEIIKVIEENNELNIKLCVAIGLVKEQKMDLILQKLTELGVSEIIPLKMERSIVKIEDKIAKKLARWQMICKEASEQSKRNIIPKIDSVLTLEELVKKDYDIKLVASVKQKENFISNYLQRQDKCVKIIIVIGPEGGISDNEEEYLNKSGYTSVTLGKMVMRVETAAIYVASIVNYSSME